MMLQSYIPKIYILTFNEIDRKSDKLHRKSVKITEIYQISIHHGTKSMKGSYIYQHWSTSVKLSVKATK